MCAEGSMEEEMRVIGLKGLTVGLAINRSLPRKCCWQHMSYLGEPLSNYN